MLLVAENQHRPGAEVVPDLWIRHGAEWRDDRCLSLRATLPALHRQFPGNGQEA
jgi:hypothetical protein